MSIVNPRLATLGLLLVGCSDQGFNIFNRDECRRDPAACLPNEEPILCDGEPATGEAISEQVCEPPRPGFDAVKFWQTRLDRSEDYRGPRQLFRAPQSDGTSELVLTTRHVTERGTDGAQGLWLLRGRDGTWVQGFRAPWTSFNPVLVDRVGMPWLHGRVDGKPTLINMHGDLRDLGGNTKFAAVMFGDFTGDGQVEVFGYASVFDLWGREIVRTPEEPDRSAYIFAPVADVTGDGRREFLSRRGYIRQDGHYSCRIDHDMAHYYIVDVDRDGGADVLAALPPDGTGKHRLALLDSQCRVVRDVVLEDVLPPEVAFHPSFPAQVSAIAPLLERGRPTFVVDFTHRDPSDGQVYANQSAVFDHELNLQTVLEWSVLDVHATTADLDGDGIYEVIRVHWRTESGEKIVGPVVVDVRTREVTVIDDVAEVSSNILYADIDGDGRGEIVASVQDHDGQWYIRAYKGAGEGYAAALPFEYQTQAPYLHNPDGTPSQEPVRYDRLGMFNAMPSGGWWAGVNSDLRVRFTDVCDEDCPANSLTYTAQVGNHGYGDVGNDVLVSVYGERGSERTLLSEQRYRDVNAGEWLDAEPVTVRFQGEPFERLRAVVSGDGYDVQECDTDNNEAVWNLDCR